MHSIRTPNIVPYCTAPAPACSCIMQLTVDADTVTRLRQLVMQFCGEAMEFMRIAVAAPGAHTRQAKVWLCVHASMVAAVMDLIVQSLPAAQFGRIATVRPV